MSQRRTFQIAPLNAAVRVTPHHLLRQIKADLVTLKFREKRFTKEFYEAYMEELSSLPTKSVILILPEDTVPLWHSHSTRTKLASGRISRIVEAVNIRSLVALEEFSGTAITDLTKILSTIPLEMFTESVPIATTSGTHEMIRTTIQLSPILREKLRSKNSPTGNSR